MEDATYGAVGSIVVLGEDRAGLKAIVAYWLGRLKQLKIVRGGSQAAENLYQLQLQFPTAVLNHSVGRLWFCGWLFYTFEGDTCGGVLCPRRHNYSAAVIECGRAYLSEIYDIMVTTIEEHCNVPVAMGSLELRLLTTYHAVAVLRDVDCGKSGVGLCAAASRVDADDDRVAHDDGRRG